MRSEHTTTGRSGVTAPGIFLGIGLGGFVDGILLHQILRWHHMLSDTEEWNPTTLGNLRVNVVADGFFHAVTWLSVVVGLVALWRAVERGTWRGNGRPLLGWILVGWGLFNVVEGVIDHHILGIHRVRPDAAAPLVYDIGFLVLGVALIAGGWTLARLASPTAGGTSVRGNDTKGNP